MFHRISAVQGGLLKQHEIVDGVMEALMIARLEILGVHGDTRRIEEGASPFADSSPTNEARHNNYSMVATPKPRDRSPETDLFASLSPLSPMSDGMGMEDTNNRAEYWAPRANNF